MYEFIQFVLNENDQFQQKHKTSLQPDFSKGSVCIDSVLSKGLFVDLFYCLKQYNKLATGLLGRLINDSKHKLGYLLRTQS